MSVGKRELKMAIVLGLILYAFFFYKFIWTPAALSISETNNKIIAFTNEKAALERDYASIEVKKAELGAKKTLNERIDEYLMNSSNLVDNLEYVDKLTLLVGKNIAEINIGKPEEKYTTRKNNPLKSDTDLSEKKQSGQKYYESTIDFKAYMTNDSAMQLIKYIEGGTQKVKITKFSIKPLKDNKLPLTAEKAPANTEAAAPASTGQAAQTPSNMPGTQEKLFEVNMTVSIYSVNIRAMDRMFEYNRHKLNRFINTGGIMFEQVQYSQDNTLTGNSANINELFGSDDIVIKQKSYLTAGENLQIFGTDRENDILRLKTDKATAVNMRFESNSYYISTKDSNKKTLEINGSLPDNEIITMSVTVDMPTIKENRNILLDLHIANNSGKKLNITLDDKQNRVKITDRKGNKIFGDSSGEHVNIL